MKKTDKNMQIQISRLLQLNTPPDMEASGKKRMLMQLNHDIKGMDYQNPQSFPEKILNQVTYFSHWVWPIQIGILALLFYFDYRSQHSSMVMYMVCLAPSLVLILLWELGKMFSHNMWEMEAACRYNLPQLILMRLCILSGVDFLVLGGAGAVFCMTGGPLWQFAFCVLLPFFLAASLCFWILSRYGGHVNIVGLAAACALLFSVWTPLISGPPIIADSSIYGDHVPAGLQASLEMLPQIALWGTLAALTLFLVSAYRLCTKQYYESTERNTQYGT